MTLRSADLPLLPVGFPVAAAAVGNGLRVAVRQWSEAFFGEWHHFQVAVVIAAAVDFDCCLPRALAALAVVLAALVGAALAAAFVRRDWMLTQSIVLQSSSSAGDFGSEDQFTESFLAFVFASFDLGVHANLLQELDRQRFGVAAHDRFEPAGFVFHALGFWLSFSGKHNRFLHVDATLFDVQPLLQLCFAQ